MGLKSHNAAFCAPCFLKFFRRQVEKGIKSQNMFTKDERILVAVSGGKDSLSLLLELKEMGYNASGLFIDLAIAESSTPARLLVENFCAMHNLELRVLELAREGIPIPEVKKTLRRPICSVCGRIKRHYFNRCAIEGGYAVMATGHNLDDEVARLFSNVLRWDESYLATQGPVLREKDRLARKVKPLWRLTEFETANYAFLRGIPHHWSPCPYSEGASFSVLKKQMNGLEKIMPGRKIDFYQGFLARGRDAFARTARERALLTCPGCGMPTSSSDLCGVCRLKRLMGVSL